MSVVEVQLGSKTIYGRGECRPYARYGESVESVLQNCVQFQKATPKIESIDALGARIAALPAGPTRNALDCAWLDWQAKHSQTPVWKQLGLRAPKPRKTAFTLSLDTPERMARAAKAAKAHSLLKIKIGADGLTHLQAVAQARPDAKLIIDANEAMSPASLPRFLDAAAPLNIALIEQPLPAGHSARLPQSPHIICADEGLHTQADLPRLKAQGYRAVNVKLDKCGGLRAGVDLLRAAKEAGFQTMAGCMVGSSLAMAPMMTAESLCDFIDLDGPLLLAKDIKNGLSYQGERVAPPSPDFWG